MNAYFVATFLDQNNETNLEYTFTRPTPDRLFLSEAWHTEAAGASRKIHHFYFNEDGTYIASMLTEDSGERETRHGKHDPSTNYTPTPTFDNLWTLLLRDR